MKKLMLSLFLLLVLTGTSISKNYFVHSQAEFKSLLHKLTAGDKIVIANGTYTGWSISISAIGTVTNPIIISAETAGGVIFTGPVNQPVFQLTGSYEVLSGFSFNGCDLSGNTKRKGVLVEFNNSIYCRVTNCTFTQNIVETQFMPIVTFTGRGNHNKLDNCNFISNINNQEVRIKVGKGDNYPTYTVIENNLFKDKNSVNWPGKNGGECVQVGQDQVTLGSAETKAIVRNNHFVNCDGDAEVISNKSSGNSYIKNTFDGCSGELVLRGGNGCIVDSNIFNNARYGAIRVNGTGHLITNNIINGAKVGIRLMYGMTKGRTETGFYVTASNCEIKHNRIENSQIGILVGDGKNTNWSGKFDNKKYPSRTLQDIAPFGNRFGDNLILKAKSAILYK